MKEASRFEYLHYDDGILNVWHGRLDPEGRQHDFVSSNILCSTGLHSISLELYVSSCFSTETRVFKMRNPITVRVTERVGEALAAQRQPSLPHTELIHEIIRVRTGEKGSEFARSL